MDSFPDYEIKCDDTEEQRIAPFRLVFEDVPVKKDHDEDTDDNEVEMLTKSISVKPYKFPNRGPYLGNKPKQ